MKLWFERGAWTSKKGSKKISAMDRLQVRRVAVIRHAALGDMVLVRPFLVEARKFFPNAEIILSLVSNYTYGAPTELVDGIHVLHGSDQENISMRERIKRAKELGAVDIVFDLADTTRSRYLCALINAQIKIGFPYRWYLRNMLFDAAVPRSDFSFEAINMLDALMLLGANPQIPPNFGWTIPHRESEKRFWGNTIVYFPFASAANKCWPFESFKSLIYRMSSRFKDSRHIVLGGIGPEESLDKFKTEIGGIANVGFQDAMSLEETVSFLRTALVVVSNDTGIRNLAISLDISSLGIFFSTVPYRYWPRYGQHMSVFRHDGKIPDLEQVYLALERFVIQKSDKNLQA